ncbi:TPA: hypothetical protein VB881_000343 [Streptococcus suis]|nr:hypothetical protein [Streptococcus suis]
MVKVELNYNPYLFETIVRFNGEEPMINSLVEKYKTVKLQQWVNQIPGIFYDEMNGFDFDLEFSGTESDFLGLKKSFLTAGISESDVRFFQKEKLEDVTTKNERINQLLSWLEVNRNRRFPYLDFIELNQDLFINEYPCLFIGSRIDIPTSFHNEVTIESIEAFNQLPSDLENTPIIFYIDMNNREVIKEFLNYLLVNSNVIQEQIFFLCSSNLDQPILERLVQDFGINSPTFLKGIADKRLLDYFHTYPQTDYVAQVLKCLQNEIEKLQAELDIENQQSQKVNALVYKKIRTLEDILHKLNVSKNQFEKNEVEEFFDELQIVKQNVIEGLQKWNKRRVRIDNDYTAYQVMVQLNYFVQQQFQEFLNQVESYYFLKSKEIENDKLGIYLKAEYKDGFEANTQLDFDRTKWYVLDMTESLKVFRKQEMVPKQDDILELINPFGKKKQRDTLEMVERITYLYQDFRDKAVELVTPVLDGVIAECIQVLKEKSNQEDRIYVLHLEELILKLEAEKEELINQLTEDEKELQLDNDWFLQFENQVHKIGRG